MLPFMRKVRIFCSDPDATDSSDEEDDQNPKKEKNLIGEVLLPLKKEPSSRFRGVRRRSWGSWQVEIRNPLTKKKESSTYKTEEEAAAAYQEKRKKYNAMKAQLTSPKCTALSSLSLSCMSTSMLCKKEQEAHDEVLVSMGTNPEPTGGSMLNFSPTPKEISVNALLSQINELPVSDCVIPADKHGPTDESVINSPTPKEISLNALLDQTDELPVSDSGIPADKHSPKDAFPISDFIGTMYEPLDYDYIGLADISHLPFPFEDSELGLDAEPDWSCFDLDLIERELNDEN